MSRGESDVFLAMVEILIFFFFVFNFNIPGFFTRTDPYDLRGRTIIDCNIRCSVAYKVPATKRF